MSIAFRTGWTVEYTAELELTVIFDIIEQNTPKDKNKFSKKEMEEKSRAAKQANLRLKQKVREAREKQKE